MDAPLIHLKASPLLLSWRRRIADWRGAKRPEVAVQLVMAAAATGAIEAGEWTVADVTAALELLHSKLPRSETRRRRLRGLLRRLQPKKPAKPRALFYIVGERAATLRITGRAPRAPGRARATGSWREMIALRHYALTRWPQLSPGREIEEAAEELCRKERQQTDKPGVSDKRTGGEASPN